MLSIDEAIESLKYDIEIDMYIRDIAPQLAEWLEELKDYRDKNKMVVRINAENADSVKDKIDKLSKYAKSQYSKAIDDFVNACKEDISCQTFGLHANGIERIAEHLKAGDNNADSN